MVSKSLIILSGAVLMASQASAQTASSGSGVYVGFVTGPQFYAGGNDAFDYNAGYAVGGQVGYRFGQWRAQAETSYHATDFRGANAVDVFDIDIINGGLGIYYDIDMGSQVNGFVPYIGGGLGIASIAVEGTEDNTFEEDEIGLTAHGELGMAVNLSGNLAIVPHYRFDVYDVDVSGFVEDVYTHSFRVAAQLGF